MSLSTLPSSGHVDPEGEPEPRRHPAPSGRQPSAPSGRGNLLAYRPVARLLRSRVYPGVFQWLTGAVFVIVVYQLLLGPDAAHDNLGTALVWVVWWPVIPIIFVVVGRFWCAICPFGKLSDLVQRLVGNHRPVPRFLKRYGIWIIDAQFIAITWADHVWGIVESPWGTGVLLLLLTTAVIVSGAFFARRTFCRYLCFLGGLAGNYTRTGALALRANTDVCATCTARAVCNRGGEKAPACPLFEFPRTMDSSANCNLCANCIKNCPNDAITLTVRPPTRELWFIRNPRIEESALAVAIMGIVFIQNITMLGIWQSALAWIRETTGLTSYPVIFTVAFVVAIAVPAGLLAAASAVARTGESTRRNFARFGYALIPLDVAGHIAHNLFHLLAEGKSVLYTAAATFSGSGGSGGAGTGHGAAAGHGTSAGDGGAGGHGDPSAALLPIGTIQILQYVIVALGVAGSAYTAYRIARGAPHSTGSGSAARDPAAPSSAAPGSAAPSSAAPGSAAPSSAASGSAASRRISAALAPYLVLLAVFGVINIVLFALPMSMRM